MKGDLFVQEIIKNSIYHNWWQLSFIQSIVMRNEERKKKKENKDTRVTCRLEATV